MALRRRLDIWDVVIVGGGMAGLTAAWQASRRGLSVGLFEAQPACGGQISTVNEIEDYPSTTLVSGPELASALAARLRIEGVGLLYESVSAAVKDGQLWHVTGENNTLRARRVIAASGARLRNLGVAGEEKFRGLGVSQCAHCDGSFFKGHDVAVIGGGDAALQEAAVLSDVCRTVYIVVRSGLKARRSYADRAAGKTNVKFIWDTEVQEIMGDKAVSGVRLSNRKTGITSDLPCAGVFPFIGVEPNNTYLPALIQRDAAGRIITNAEFRTSDPTLYAVGALRSGYGGDLVSAVGEAAAAALMVANETGIPAL